MSNPLRRDGEGKASLKLYFQTLCWLASDTWHCWDMSWVWGDNDLQGVQKTVQRFNLDFKFLDCFLWHPVQWDSGPAVSPPEVTTKQQTLSTLHNHFPHSSFIRVNTWGFYSIVTQLQCWGYICMFRCSRAHRVSLSPGQSDAGGWWRSCWRQWVSPPRALETHTCYPGSAASPHHNDALLLQQMLKIHSVQKFMSC